MPVGRETHHQRLIQLVRHGEHDYHERWLGDVSFVPLIGEDGWADY
jgi:protein-L-isoaspartate(D-aspartate) O-methyltransferase